MKKFFWLFGAIAVVVAATWLWRRQSVIVVPVATVEKGTAVDAVTGTVKVFASADLKVQTEREGRLTEIRVNVGDFVAKGDLLVRQDSLELEYQMDQERVRRQAAMDRMALPLSRSFDVENTKTEVEALKLEVELGQSPRSRLTQAERELRKLEMLLAEEGIQRRESAGVLDARVKGLELELEKMRVTAPFDGEVVEIYSVVGNQLGRNVDLLRLVSPGRFAEMLLNEEDFDGVAVGQRVTLRLASYGNREFEGTVSSLSATADADEKTRKLFVDIKGDQNLLVPGLTGEGYLIKQEHPDALRIPRRALRGNRVWVVKDGKLEERTVTPGFLDLRQAEILSGLEVGEHVVLEDQDLLTEGQSVRMRED